MNITVEGTDQTHIFRALMGGLRLEERLGVGAMHQVAEIAVTNHYL
jgi:hypothetical protein